MRGSMRFMPHNPGFGGHHGGHRQRARRGAIRGAIVKLLSERPMHGYELISELEERTGGRWRPSPGSVYPTLAALEDEGLIQAIDEDGRKRYELTDAGRQWLAAQPTEDAGPPWARDTIGGSRGDLRRLGGELFGQLRQIGRFGSTAQQDKAKEILATARDALYAVLAEPRTEDAAADDTPDAPAT